MLQMYFSIYPQSAPASSAKSDQDWYAPPWSKRARPQLGPHGHSTSFQPVRRTAFWWCSGCPLYREPGEQEGRRADGALTSSHRCWDLQNWWHPHWIITTEQHVNLLLFGSVLWCFLQSGLWNWAGPLQLLASVCSGFSCTFIQWHREVHNKMP